MEAWFRRAILNPTIAYAADIRDEIGRVPTDAVLTLDVLFGAVLGAEAAGVPVAMLSPHVSIRPLTGIPPATTGMAQPKTREERAEVAAANENFTEVLHRVQR